MLRGYSPLLLWNKLVDYWIAVFGKNYFRNNTPPSKVRQAKPNVFKIDLSSNCQVLREKHRIKKNRNLIGGNPQNATSK